MEEITSPNLDAMQFEDMEKMEKTSSIPIVPKSVEDDNENVGEAKKIETKAPKRLVLRMRVNHNKRDDENNNNFVSTDVSNNGTQEFGDASDHSTTSGEVGDESADRDSDNSEKSKESEENDQPKFNFRDDEEMTRTEIGTFIDNMKSNSKYKLLKYRSWQFYEPTHRDIKLFDRMNLYDFAVNLEANVLISLGQIVQVKRRKKGVNWAILSIGHLEISGRGRFSSILRREDTIEMIAVPIFDLIPDSRKVEISDQQLEELLAQYHSTLTQPKAKSALRGRKRTQTNYFTPSPPNKRLKPPTFIPKSTPKSTVNNLRRDPIVVDDSFQFESDARSNSPASYLYPNKDLGSVNALNLDSDSNSVKSVKKSEEHVPISNGSTGHVGEVNSHFLSPNLSGLLSSQTGISNPSLQEKYFNSNAPSCPLQLCEMYLLNQQQQIQQFQIDQHFQQQQHQRQQEYSRQQQLRHLQLQHQLETQFDLQRQVHSQFETQQHFQFQLFQQQQRVINQIIMSKR